MADFHVIKGFVLDLDGVIADTARFHGEAWHQTANRVGTIWTDSLADGLKGISRMDSLEMILKAGGHEKQYTEQQKEQLAAEKNKQYLTLIAGLTPEDLLPGMAAFLNSIKTNGYGLALASASKNAPIILKGLGIAELFDAVVDPATLKAGKPDPEIFARGASLLHLQPGEVIGIEDAAAGIQSIHAAGEVSIGIGDKNTLAHADILFASTAGLTLDNIAGSVYFAQ
ncbi:MAG: beta-phosphoglucomutase [Sporolactobacillus sp.]